MPLAALFLSLAASQRGSRISARSITEVTTVAAPLADQARALQLDVLHIQDAFTDLSATRLAAEKEEAFAVAESHRQSFLRGLTRFAPAGADRSPRAQQLATITSALERYVSTGRAMATAFVDGRVDEAQQLMTGFDQASLDLEAALQPLVDEQLERLNTGLQTSVQQQAWLNRWSMIIGLGLATCSAALAHQVIRTTNAALVDIASPLDDSANELAKASTEVSSASQSLAGGASQQAASLEETSASLEEMAAMTRRNAESAAQAHVVSQQTRAAADLGTADMTEMKLAMDAIKGASDQIAKIIKTIDEIAFQTNILALNAAVEAARAGEAGLGFAVVADEVRTLAQRAAQSARETADCIDDSVRKSEHGVRICQKVEQSLAEIVAKARQVDTFVNEIAQASAEQQQGIGQVNTAIAQMDHVTQQNAAHAEETAAAAEELNGQAAALREQVVQLQQLIGRAA